MTSALTRATLLFFLVLGVLTPYTLLAESCAEYAAGRVRDTPHDRKAHELFSNESIYAAGDFDGDGRRDEAFFSKRAGEYHLVACLNDGKEAFSLHKVRYVTERSVYSTAPGIYLSACAKGYASGCNSDDLAEVELEHDAIMFIHKAGMIFYWANGDFRKVWISD